jgi:hypothetical protein
MEGRGADIRMGMARFVHPSQTMKCQCNEMVGEEEPIPMSYGRMSYGPHELRPELRSEVAGACELQMGGIGAEGLFPGRG